MILRLKASSSLKDWVSLPSAELRDRGFDPHERLNRTGHAVALGDLWLRTVGRWCIGDTATIKECVPHVDKRSFETYKHRHRLRTFQQFKRRYGDSAWSLPEVLYGEFVKVQSRRRFSSFGEPARSIGEKIGVLPIEVVVYNTMFQEFLDLMGIDKKNWARFTNDEKDHQWEQGCAAGAGDFYAIFERQDDACGAGSPDGVHGEEPLASVS